MRSAIRRLAAAFAVGVLASPAAAAEVPACGDVDGDGTALATNDLAVLAAFAVGRLSTLPSTGGLRSPADLDGSSGAPDWGDVVAALGAQSGRLTGAAVDCGDASGAVPPPRNLVATLRLWDLETAFSPSCTIEGGAAGPTRAALEDVFGPAGELAIPAAFLTQTRAPGGSRLLVPERTLGSAPRYFVAGALVGQRFDGELYFEVGDDDALAGRLRMSGLWLDRDGQRVHGFAEGSGPGGCAVETAFTFDFPPDFDPEMAAAPRTIDRLLLPEPSYCLVGDGTRFNPPFPAEAPANGADDDCDGLVDEPPAFEAGQALAGVPDADWGAARFAGSCAPADMAALEALLASTPFGNLEDLVRAPAPGGSLLRSLEELDGPGWTLLGRFAREGSTAAFPPFAADVFHDAGGTPDFTVRIGVEGVYDRDAGPDDRVVAEWRAAVAPGCRAAGTVLVDDLPNDFEPDGALAFVGGRDLDADGAPDGTDCNDFHPAISPLAPEAPGNGVDDDCDGLVNEGAEAAIDVLAFRLYDLDFDAECAPADARRLTDELAPSDDGEGELRLVEERQRRAAGAIRSVVEARTNTLGDRGVRLVGAFSNNVLGVRPAALGSAFPFEGALYFHSDDTDGAFEARLDLAGSYVEFEPGEDFDRAVYGRLQGALAPACRVTGGFTLAFSNAFAP